ncbi:protein adenylyltransferase SelO [Maritimibacter harenae]|nr:YdiU family protein [Maritimibacter harenae]
MGMSIAFDNSYARLPDTFYSRLSPEPVSRPEIVALNRPLADELGIDPDALTADILAGNALPDGAEPLAQLYAGHQFGNFVPQLGDGRAILLGEVIDTNGKRRDIQLKGSGRTPYSRGGDGRAWLGPVLREYVVSEAMHALGIPTTRALAAVTTGDDVIREAILPGAVMTRVASSHLRVGTFQVFASRGQFDALRDLTDHAIARHYPDAQGPLDLLSAVTEAQAELIAAWMSVGFIHGVMNTDNMAISGETIDYGPCAFMDAYHPNTVFSSIDQMGRYAYQNQPNMAVWNLAQLASSLLPLIEGGEDAAIEAAEDRLHAFPDLFGAAWIRRFRAKIGLTTEEEGDGALIQGLLQRMATSGADFTNTFRALADGDASEYLAEPGAWESWAADWRARLERQGHDGRDVMRAANPAVIPRNHRVEEVIQAGIDGDFAPLHRLNAVLAEPFSHNADTDHFAKPPAPEERVTRTFCGT